MRRQPQHLGNHDHRQRTGHRRHQVEAGRVGDGVEQFDHDPPDMGLEGVDGPRGKGLIDQDPQARMLRRVQEQQGPVSSGGMK